MPRRRRPTHYQRHGGQPIAPGRRTELALVSNGGVQGALLRIAEFGSLVSRARPSGAPVGRPARCGRHTSGRRPRSRRPPTNPGQQDGERHPTRQLPRARRASVARPRIPAHQSSASTPRVQGAPTSRHYVIGKPTLDPFRCGLRSAATGCGARCGAGRVSDCESRQSGRFELVQQGEIVVIHIA